MNELMDMLYRVLENIGIFEIDRDDNLKIRDIIQDSLTYISFFIEVEKAFDIEIPDQMYTDEIYSYTLEEFVEKIILPLKKEKN